MRYASFALSVFVACAPKATFNEDHCPFTVHSSQVQGKTMRCGVLQVALTRGQVDSKRIDVPVLIFKGQSRSEPVVNLAGGPGQSWKDLGLEQLDSTTSAFLPRDFVFIEQRGADLKCPDQGKDEADEAYIDRCRTRLELEGTQLDAYNTVELADDVADFKEALGYDSLVLNGVSYGTAWGQEVMRRHEKILSGVILDSVVSPATPPLSQIASAQESALDALFRECAGNGACKKTYGDIESKMKDTLDALEKKKLPAGGNKELGPHEYFALVMQTLQATPGSTPMLIDHVHAALTAGEIQLADDSGGFEPVIAIGQYFSVMCSDNQFVTAEQVQADRQSVRAWMRPYVEDGGDLVKLCERWAWKKRTEDGFSLVAANVRTLLLSGTLDFATPPKWAREVAAALPNSNWVQARGVGHGVAAGGGFCVGEIVAAFLMAPAKMDTSCADDMRPQFEMPDGSRAERAPLRFPSSRLSDRLPRLYR